jgi:hypothetical protein
MSGSLELAESVWGINWRTVVLTHGRLDRVSTVQPVQVSAVRRRAVIDALRRGAVPESGLDLLATGLDRFESAIDAELDAVGAGGSVFTAPMRRTCRPRSMS